MTSRGLVPRALAPLLLGAAALGVATVRAADGAVILMYHHVAPDTPASTSVTPQRFAAHLDYLDEHGFNVWPLLRILEALRAGRALPDKTVALTFDDGYVSVLENALPLMRDRGWPFTVFVSTDYLDRGYGGYLSWEQLRALALHGATVGNHSRSHGHFPERKEGESDAAWRQRIREEISGAGDRIRDEVADAAIPVLAYPYGEYDAEIEEIVADLGLFAVGQQSGAVGARSDLLAAPRFPLSTGYDGPEEFASRVISRALPVEIVGTERHVLEPDETEPELRLRIGEGDFDLARLACYAPAEGRMALGWLEPGELLLRPRSALGPGRTKYNCTAPSTADPGVYYWYSYLWMKKKPDGSWYAE